MKYNVHVVCFKCNYESILLQNIEISLDNNQNNIVKTQLFIFAYARGPCGQFNDVKIISACLLSTIKIAKIK